jgi:myo-inositol 2-dehydrogenase / D-chiro-inositol 1-dehydrogenase
VSVGIGIAGAGGMGATHARLLAQAVPGAHLAAVADVAADAARAVADGTAADGAAAPAVHADGRALVADPGVGAVVVAAPSAAHEELVLACLAAGKPVLCEKPLADTVQACRRLVAAEAVLDRRLVQVGFMRRFDPGYVAMRARLATGEIGAPLVVHCTHRNASVPPFFTSEMVLTDSAVHEIDVLRWLLDDEIVRVTAFAPRASSRVAGGMQDPALLVLETAGGALADVEVFVNATYGYDVRCEVVGETGTVALVPPAAVAVRRAGRDAVDVPAGYAERFADAYVAELRAFVAAAAGGAVAGPTTWDGYAAAAVAHAAVEAWRTGRPVDVALEPRPALYAPDRTLVSR